MSEFAKTFLRDRLGDDKQPKEVFGIFGKHPGWNDHIEDLPLPTASMATAKQLLYVQGIGSQISSGAWARLAESARLPDFDHVLLWVRGCQFLAGRMWASRDGKRRAHFPMVALVHAAHVARDTMLEPILVQLDQVAAGCRAARTAEEVREVIGGEWNAASAAADRPAAHARITLGLTPEAVIQLAGEFRERSPRCVRLPADPDDVCRSLRFWSRLCTVFAPAELPLLFLAPLSGPWIDVLVGEPAPDSFFGLRATPQALPIAGSVAGQEASRELDAEELVKSLENGPGTAEERGWISRFLRH